MWKGRFEEETSDLVQRYGESISFDWRLYPHDIRGSIAHAGALVRAGILTDDEFNSIRDGLTEIGEEIKRGDFEFSMELEDIHMNIESALTKKIGAAGAKLHTARSRNDQVALDTRLYCKTAVAEVLDCIHSLQSALVSAGEKAEGTVLPGYTHLQRGQPVLFAHHLLAYVEMLGRDADRLQSALERLDVMPLGSGALAGSTIALDREGVAEELGFARVSRNSMDAISDRDYVADILYSCSLIGAHLSRLSEDVILWCSSEFNFVTLSDAHTTGSSLMPQKKNPDVAELTRGKSGRLYGNLVNLLTAVKGLPLTYNRDLQEDKSPLFDSIDTVKDALTVFAEMMAAMEVNSENCRAAAEDPMLLATDLADYLVLRGVPFREAHEVVGSLTALSVKTKTPLNELSTEQMREFCDVIEEDVLEVFDLDRAVAARTATGAPSPANVSKELAAWKEKLQA